jgi:DHA3 family macrolide efflux protein-like MFS transporter
MAIAGTFVVGMMSPITMGPFFAIVQSKVEPDMQARIFSLLGVSAAAWLPLGRW